jgi:hypothetical protein
MFILVIPPPPTNIKVAERGTMYIKIQWERPLNWETYHIKSYVIRYKKQSSSVFNGLIEVDSGTFSKTITGLEKNTKYDFQMYSKNTIGQGPSSLIISDITFSGK